MFWVVLNKYYFALVAVGLWWSRSRTKRSSNPATSNTGHCSISGSSTGSTWCGGQPLPVHIHICRKHVSSSMSVLQEFSYFVSDNIFWCLFHEARYKKHTRNATLIKSDPSAIIIISLTSIFFQDESRVWTAVPNSIRTAAAQLAIQRYSRMGWATLNNILGLPV